VRRTLGTISMIVLVGGALAAPASAGVHEARGASRPDAWIKLCGQSLGCVIDPLPHPWRGNNIYNTSANRQTERDDINEGEGIRYWIAIQNDGGQQDTIYVQGCSGNQDFKLHAVLVGRHKGLRPPGVENVTDEYKRGSLSFDLAPGQAKFITVNIITQVRKHVTYRCETSLRSSNGGGRDVVAAIMTTF
jgi:hypothetical protein